MLSLILFPLVEPYIVWMLAVNWEFIFFHHGQVFPSTPFLLDTYSIAIQASFVVCFLDI